MDNTSIVLAALDKAYVLGIWESPGYPSTHRTREAYEQALYDSLAAVYAVLEVEYPDTYLEYTLGC